MPTLRTLNRRSETGAQPEIFQGKEGFAALEHFDKSFVKNTQKKKTLQVNFLVFFSRYSQNYILNVKFKQKMSTIRAFSCNVGSFFSILKKEQRRPPA